MQNRGVRSFSRLTADETDRRGGLAPGRWWKIVIAIGVVLVTGGALSAELFGPWVRQRARTVVQPAPQQYRGHAQSQSRSQGQAQSQDTQIAFGGQRAIRRSAGASGQPADRGEKATVRSAALGEVQLSGPFTHRNLSVFFVHARPPVPGERVLGLDEAIRTSAAIVHETGSVNELEVENRSDQKVFCQAGDIVRGGRQDRVLAHDLVLEPRTGRTKIKSFCVEQGRWQGRGAEPSTHFAESSQMVSSNRSKQTVRYAPDSSQGKVWSYVEETQKSWSGKLGKPVASATSESSLQLALENRDLRTEVDNYVRALQSCLLEVPKSKPGLDAIGCVVAIDGRVDGGDLYGSSDVFRKVWPRLLKAAATTAAETAAPGMKPGQPPTEALVRRLLESPASGSGWIKELPSALEEATVEYGEFVMFETRKTGTQGAWIRRSYMVREGSESK